MNRGSFGEARKRIGDAGNVGPMFVSDESITSERTVSKNSNDGGAYGRVQKEFQKRTTV